MMRNRMAFLLAAGTMTMTSAAGLAGCTSAPASVTVQSAENTGITVTSQEKIKAEPDIAEITYSVYSQAADASTCQSENQTDLGEIVAVDDSTMNVLFAIEKDGEELLLPAHEEFICKLDKKKRLLTVDVPDGLL